MALTRILKVSLARADVHPERFAVIVSAGLPGLTRPGSRLSHWRRPRIFILTSLPSSPHLQAAGEATPDDKVGSFGSMKPAAKD